MPPPVLYIPGLPGSHLRTHPEGRRFFLRILSLLPAPSARILRLLTGPDDLTQLDGVVAGLPIRRGLKILIFDLAKQAGSLYDILRGLGIAPIRFGWDWRRPVWDPLPIDGTPARLEAEIRAANAAGGPVTVIAHSTGGLVIRHLLETKARAGDLAFVRMVGRIIAFGVPWAGTLKSMRFLLAQRGFHTISRSQAQRVIGGSWAAFDLLPPDPAKTTLVDGAGFPLRLTVDGNGRQTSLLIDSKRGWFESTLADGMRLRAEGADTNLGTRTVRLRLGGVTVPVTNVAGYGASTTTRAVITGSGGSQRVELQRTDQGDQTVPFRSARWIDGAGVDRFHLPVGFYPGNRRNPHSSLWRNPGGRNLLRHLLGGAPLEPFVYAAVDIDDFRDPAVENVRVRMSTLDAGAAPLSGVRVEVRLRNNPRQVHTFADGDGRHEFTVPRARMTSVGAVGQFLRFSTVIEAGGQRFRPRGYFVRG